MIPMPENGKAGKGFQHRFDIAPVTGAVLDADYRIPENP